MAHIVKLLDDLEFRTPAEFDGRSKGYATDAVVDEPGGGVQMGFRVSRLGRRRRASRRTCSRSRSRSTSSRARWSLDTVGGMPPRWWPGDYGLVPVGMTHALRNVSDAPASFAEMQAPLPRERFGYDTQFPERRGARRRDPAPRRRARSTHPFVRSHRRRVHGPGAADPGPPGRERQHADRAARLQRHQREDDGRRRPGRRPVHDVHGPVRAGRVRRRARPPAGGGLPDPRGRGRGRLRRQHLPPRARRRRLGGRRVRARVPQHRRRPRALARDAGAAATETTFLPVRPRLDATSRTSRAPIDPQEDTT